MPQVHATPTRGTEPAHNGHRLGPARNGSSIDEDWLAGVTRAMQLAAKQAHLVAYQTGTGVLYRREDGAVGIFKPDPAMYEDLIPPPFEDEIVLRYEAIDS